jgi:hypothetical protein
MKQVFQQLQKYSRSRKILPEERAASTFIIKKINEISSYLNTSEVRKAKRFNKSVIGEKTYEELSGTEVELLRTHLSALSGCIKAQEDLLELRLTAYSLTCHLLGIGEVELRRKVRRRPWKFQHEILVRFSWMRHQKQQILEGVSFNHPFLCNVGSVQGRKNMDREFYAMLEFPPLFFEYTGSKLLFELKTIPFSRPDFLVRSETGQRIGIEVTESNMHADSHEQDALIEKIQDAIYPKFRKQKFALVLRGAPSTSAMNSSFKDAIEWIINQKNLALSAFKKDEEYSAWNKTFNLSLEFHKNDFGYTFSTTGETLIGIKPELDLAASLRACIDKKLKGRISNIRPCHLLIIIRDGVPFVKESLVKKITTLDLPDHTTHFDEIWALHGKRLLHLTSTSATEAKI